MGKLPNIQSPVVRVTTGQILVNTVPGHTCSVTLRKHAIHCPIDSRKRRPLWWEGLVEAAEEASALESERLTLFMRKGQWSK